MVENMNNRPNSLILVLKVYASTCKLTKCRASLKIRIERAIFTILNTLKNLETVSTSSLCCKIWSEISRLISNYDFDDVKPQLF